MTFSLRTPRPLTTYTPVSGRAKRAVERRLDTLWLYTRDTPVTAPSRDFFMCDVARVKKSKYEKNEMRAEHTFHHRTAQHSTTRSARLVGCARERPLVQTRETRDESSRVGGGLGGGEKGGDSENGSRRRTFPAGCKRGFNTKPTFTSR